VGCGDDQESGEGSAAGGRWARTLRIVRPHLSSVGIHRPVRRDAQSARESRHRAWATGGGALETRNQVTELLVAWRSGDATAADRLFAAVYDDLRRIARRQLASERPGHTLRATALVHEAYMRLVDQTRADWSDR